MKKSVEKELKKLLEELTECISKNDFNIEKAIEDSIDKAFNQPCSISIEKDANGEATLSAKGNNIALLITLAGLEKSILEKTNPPAGLYEMIKRKVGVKTP